MSKADRKVRLQRRSAQLTVSKQFSMMEQAANALDEMGKRIQHSETSRDFLRNLLVASAFARGLGNERPLTEVILECTPLLMGVNPGAATNRDMAAL